MRQFLIFSCLISIFSSAIQAQNTDSLRSEYVKEFPDDFNVKLFATNRLLILNLVGKSQGKARINYAPNDRGYIGIGAYIFDLGLEFSVKVPLAFQRSKSRYGDTDFIDFQGSLYGRKWSVDGTFQKYDGFYVSNAIDLYPDFNTEDNFPQRSDLSVMNIGVNAIHIFNHKRFSFRSGFVQADRQIKSAGSPILILSATRFSVKADSLLVPVSVLENYGNASSFKEGRFLTFSVLAGYAYDFVFKRFFVKLNVNGGVGVQHQKFDLNKGGEERWAIEPKLNFRTVLGYDNDRFFSGVSFMMEKTSINFEGMRINNTTGNYQIFAGYRFEKIGILKKYSVKDIIPFKWSN